MIDLGTLYMKVEAKTDGAVKSLQSFGKAADNASGKGKFIAKGLEVSRKAFIACSAAVTAGIVAIKKWAGATAQAGDEIDKNSQKMRVSAEDYQAISYAADLAGISTQTFMKAAKSLNGSEWEGNLTGYLDSLMQIEDVDKRVAMAQDMLGDRTAQAMMPFLNGTKSISEYKDELAAVGGIMSNEAVKNSAAYNDALTTLHASMAIISNLMAEKVLPTLTKIIESVSSWVSNNQEKLSKIFEKVTGFINFIIKHGDVVIAILTGIGTALLGFKVASIIMALTTAIEAAGGAMAALNAIMLANPVGLVVAAIAALIAILVLLIKNWDKVKATLKKGLNAVVNSTPVQTAINAIKKLIEWWNNLKAKLRETLTAKVKTKKDDAAGVGKRIGLREVPYDDYSALLHKGETILTAAETNQYKKFINGELPNQNKGGGAVINFNGTYSFMDKKQVDYFMKQAETMIKRRLAV